MQHVFIVGSKGIPAAYGGFETFVEKLTAYRRSAQIRYHVSRLSDRNGTYAYNGAECFDVRVPDIGAAKAVYYDVAALNRCIRDWKRIRRQKTAEEGGASRPVFYVLACRIGPFAGYFKRRIHKLGGVLFVNPDGHEWKRSKWNALIRTYWKYSEKKMVKHADLLVCDSKNIRTYIQTEYRAFHPETVYLAYGSDTEASAMADRDAGFTEWLAEHRLTPQDYYLVVGRFVPENNFRTMLAEFLRSDSAKSLAVVTTPNDALYERLDAELHFSEDSRIRFVGTVYDEQLLKKIRENAYGYLHGHEVGGTNPSLLEALGSTKLNLLFRVGFNEEVAEDAALYWTKEAGSLAACIEKADKMSEAERERFGQKAKARIRAAYSWDDIVEEYESLFQTVGGVV